MITTLIGSTATAQRVRSHRPRLDHTRKGAPYRLDAGDMLAIIIEGVVGDFRSAQIHLPSKNKTDIIPAVGHPFVVMDDGTLPLPLVDAVPVRGMTVTEAKRAVAKAYVDEEILQHARNASVTLLRKRTVNVTVLHDRDQRGIGVSVKLPADRAQITTALATAGPYDVLGEVRIIGQGTRKQLSDRDVIQVRSKPTRYFYTGGLTDGGRHRLPSHRRLNPLQAIALAGGITQRTKLGPTRLTVVRAGGPSFTISYAQLLRHPNGYFIQPGDTIIPR